MGAFRMLRPAPVAGYTGQPTPCPPDPDPCAQFQLKACCVTMGPYNSRHMAGCYDATREVCCVGANGSPPPMDRMSWICPRGTTCPGKFNPNAKCGGCTQDEQKCGTACCKRGEFCASQPRAVCCKNGQKACVGAKGVACCTADQQCRDGICCAKCGGNGICCDAATTFCCREPGDPTSEGRCCKKDLESCCGVGPDGAQKRMCCAKPNKCVKQLPAGMGAFTASSPWVCCPPDRQVPAEVGSPNITACCDPSQVSLEGKFLVGTGVQGFCCDPDKICGKGANLTCCPKGQSCIGTTTCA